jgi:predicted CoA-binding protein
MPELDMSLTLDKDIARVLSSTRTIALLGASAKAQRPSHAVMAFLLQQGYEVFPVNPGLAGQMLQGRLVYSRLEDVPAAIDMVDVFRNAAHLPEIVTEAIGVGASVLWTQLDVVNELAATTAKNAGMEVIMDRCPAIEVPRLRAIGLMH